MGPLPIDQAAHKLRLLHDVQAPGFTGRVFRVCSTPSPCGELTEAEYAPYLAAADGKHNSYMRHGAPWAPGDLAYEVTVKNTVVAWLPYDGMPRVITRDFGDRAMNQARDLAILHLGNDPATQQKLADERGDIDRLSVGGFRRVIFEHLERAALGSKYNDFPTDMSVREWFAMRRQEELEKEQAQPQQSWRAKQGYPPYVPNPTVAYTDEQRRGWALEAAHYLAAFRDRYPHEYTLWTTDQHWSSHGRGRPGPLQVAPGDRIGISDHRELLPAVVLTAQPCEDHQRGTVRTETRVVTNQCMHRRNTAHESTLLPETRALWAPVWDQLAAADRDTAPAI
ncbi:hypothetical protein [Streptomyces sp. MI02-7b]|uniref:hypothetical protein n=1 Tax=Streptomyces sp. MI02-7b TaxID=462941 RepID=UPI0029A88D06|nr:hypothetical protein [Streptomyces sp. MI02-7b]MDX3075915.1 hypothetical protein [Streptomyces sp. MI02-7b]